MRYEYNDIVRVFDNENIAYLGGKIWQRICGSKSLHCEFEVSK